MSSCRAERPETYSTVTKGDTVRDAGEGDDALDGLDDLVDDTTDICAYEPDLDRIQVEAQSIGLVYAGTVAMHYRSTSSA